LLSANAPVTAKRWVVTGIPVFQAEVPGRIRAALMFRVGQADEPLHMAGVTHLIEHLALSGLGEQPYDYNGFVDQVRTAFTVTGTAAQVVDFFNHVTAALAALPLDRVPTERRIIESEAAGHYQSSFRETMRLRYGATGFGTVDYSQIGMRWLTPQAVQAWAARHFTAGNAAAWLAGPVVPELRFDLPPGGRLAPPVLTPKRLHYPVLVEQQSLGVTLSMVGLRSTALTTGLSILGHRAMQRIRYTEGLSYGVQTRYEQLDGRLAHLIAHTDPLLEHSTQAGSALLDVADVLSLTGPDAAELARAVAAMDEALSDPQSAIAEMDSAVHDELLGVAPFALSQVREEAAALTPARVAAALKTALDTLILVIPTGTRTPRPHFAPYPTQEAHALPGTEFPHLYGSGEHMVVGPSGISLRDADRRALNILWQEIVVGARWDDGTRLLVGRDGTVITFRPPVWRNPGVVLAAIDSNAPADRLVNLEGPSPSAELPRAPKTRRQGSILAGRAPQLLIFAGLVLVGIAATLFVVMNGRH
jgi:zinc protease